MLGADWLPMPCAFDVDVTSSSTSSCFVVVQLFTSEHEGLGFESLAGRLLENAVVCIF
jgi:hypothetical protein